MSSKPTAAAATSPSQSVPSEPRAVFKRPRILVTGFNELRVERVCRGLGQLRALVEKTSWEATLSGVSGAAAVVLVDPIRRLSAGAAVAKVREQREGAEVPLFVVIDEGASSRRVLRLYSTGASAVFEWPAEASVMASLLAEAFGIVKIRGRSSEPDQALARAVRARLRLYPELPKTVRLFSQDGLISVAGQVASLAQCRELFDVIAAVPGVRGVIQESLSVAPTGHSDRKLEQRLKALLEITFEDTAKQLETSVESRVARLTGTVENRADIRLLGRLIANVQGIRGIELRLTAASDPPDNDRRAARRLRRAVALLYPREPVRLEVVDGTAILSGSVTSLLTRSSISRFVSHAEGVHRVVDKITVT